MNFAISQFRNFAISQFRNFAISQFRNFAISQFRNFAGFMKMQFEKSRTNHQFLFAGIFVGLLVLTTNASAQNFIVNNPILFSASSISNSEEDLWVVTPSPKPKRADDLAIELGGDESLSIDDSNFKSDPEGFDLDDPFHFTQSSSIDFLINNLNNNDASTLSNPVRSDLWFATSFTTGSQVKSLHSVIIRARREAGSGSGSLVATIYENNSRDDDNPANDRPSTLFANLGNSQDLGTNDEIRLYPNGSVELAANTIYWLAVGATESARYRVFSTSSTSHSGDSEWEVGGNILISIDRANWGVFPFGVGTHSLVFGIVPEPDEYLLASALIICIFILTRRRSIASQR